jgi:tight adherence protein C
VTEAIVLGMSVGLGLIGLVAGLRPRYPALAATLEALDADPSIATAQARRSDGEIPACGPVRTRVRRALSRRADVALDKVPATASQIRQELLLCDLTLDELLERTAFGALTGAFSPFLLWALLSVVGLDMPLVLPLWIGLTGALCGALLPFLSLRARAKNAQRHARRVIGCFLDLVVLALAGGLGIEGALYSAAEICDTGVSRKLTRVLGEARDAGRTPWEALARLGGETGVSELSELAAAVSLAGTEGARIKSTLAAKAASIRHHELADAEADANTITERLFLPGVFMLLGFLVFIGYPAVARLTEGL